MRSLIVLLHLALGLASALEAAFFDFTRPVYNLSISEKWDLTNTAWSDRPDRVGVPIPAGYDNVKFKIVQGEGAAFFKATARKVADFAYMVVVLKPNENLNRELQDEYSMVVKASARKKGEVNYEAQCVVNVAVIDDNDILPFFSDSEYQANVNTTLPKNGRVVQLHAVDADIGLNGEFVFSMEGPSDFFYVEQYTGWIRSYRRLKAGVYVLKCLVEDRASRLANQRRSSMFNSAVQVIIHVHEARPAALKLAVHPQPLRPYTAGLQKAALLTASSPLANLDLSAHAVERGDVVLERQSATQYLLYQARTGRDAPPPISVLLKHNQAVSLENVTLEMDSASRKTWFNGTSEEDTPRLKLQLSDTVPVNGFVHIFRALTTYPQDGPLITYRIHGKESSKVPFQVDKTSGILRVKTKLTGPTQYEFSVVAKLDGVEEKALIDVFVTVDASNDRCPKILNPTSDFNVKVKHAKANSVLFKPKLSSDGRSLRFQLKKPYDGDLVEVNEMTGEIVAKKDLSSVKDFTVTLMVIQDGEPVVQYTWLDVHFSTSSSNKAHNIRDSCHVDNKHSPEFTQFGPLKVGSTASVGTEIGRIKAKDADLGLNGLVRYTSDDSFFGVDYETGIVTLIRPLVWLESASSQTYEIKVNAVDLALEKPRMSSITVQIQIEPRNANAPEFEKAAYFIHVQENWAPNSALLRLNAMDKDVGPAGRVEYRLVSETDFVTVDPDSGEFKLERALDREERDSVTFTVAALDRGSPPKLGYCNVTLLVDDVNDVTPECGRSLHRAKIFEDTPGGAIVTCLVAFDLDQGKNAELSFSIDGDLPFRMDESTGCVFLKADASFGQQLPINISFPVTVTDKGEPALSTKCATVITVVDVNSNQLPPLFSEPVYTTQIDENVDEKRAVTRVAATDPEGQPVTYEIIGGSGVGFFTVDETNGEVYAIRALDAETHPTLSLAVRALDNQTPPLWTVCQVVVVVNDVNDHVPFFSQPVYHGYIDENSEANKVVVRVNATDGDITHNDISYSVDRGNVQSNFVLDSVTGFLVTGQRRLDRETQERHELYVKACDSATPPRCSTTLVLVQVLDLNDNAPKFKHTAQSVKVRANVSGVLCRVFAEDLDQDGPNSMLNYSLDGPKDNFAIDGFGYISVRDPLPPGFSTTLTVKAEDQGEPRLRTELALTLSAAKSVSASASSNSVPRFRAPEKWRHLYASDRDTVSTVLGRVEVDDEDGDPIWFKITDKFWNPNETFSFSGNDGDIVLARRVNSIEPNVTTVELEVVASDGWAEIRENVFIHVTRSADVRPHFERNVSQVDLAADFPVGFVIHQLSAVIDAPAHSAIRRKDLVYEIHSVDDILAAESVKIDPTTASLLLEKRVPSQASSRFTVTVSCKVNGGLESFAFVHFNRVFVNEFTPQCLSSVFQFYHHGINQFLGRVQAFDLDRGNNGVLMYNISEGNDDKVFAIDQDSGELSVSKELNQNRTFIVKVSDKGSVQKSTLCSVVVVVPTSHAAKHAEKNITLSLPMGPATTKPLFLLNSTSVGFESFCFMQDSCKFLDVEFSSGSLTKSSFLGLPDVTESECGIGSESGDAEVRRIGLLKVQTVKDWPSWSVEQIEGYVSETAAPGSVVYKDWNLTEKLVVNFGAGFTFRIINPQERFFGINPESKTVYVRQAVEFIKHHTWSFVVGIHNPQKKVSALVTINLHILRANKRGPALEEDLTFQLALPAIKGTLIGVISAVDPDGDDVKFALLHSNQLKGHIEVNRESGELSVRSAIGKMPLPSVGIQVIATDGTHTSGSNVTIQFTSSSSHLTCTEEYIVQAPENYTAGPPKHLANLDWPLDMALGDSFRFRLLTRGQSSFLLDPRTGALHLNPASPLDREREPTLDMVVRVESVQKADRFCESVLRVRVEDENDCAPVFHHLPYEISLTEDARAGDRLLSVKAKDEDAGVFGTVRYSLSEDAPDYLEINKVDGKVRLKKTPAELVVGSTSTFVVTAYDQGNPSLKSDAPITLIVSNRHQPIFSHNRYTTRISESSASGTTIFSVQAKSNTDGVVAYVISDGDPRNQFAMDFHKGRLSVNKALDRESKKEYTLQVMALDLSRPGVNATAFVKIHIDDVNDSPPVFLQNVYTWRKSESTETNSILGQVQAKDPDTQPTHNNITYNIVEGQKNVISVDSQTGNVYLSQMLDFETENEFEWTIGATDSDGLQGLALLRLIVEDENDNKPSFVDASPFRMDVRIDNSEDRFLHLFKVTDPDQFTSFSNSAGYLFQIQSGDETLFAIDATDGILKRIRDLDSEETEKLANGEQIQYELSITVSDGKFSSVLAVQVVFSPSNSFLNPFAFGRLVQTATISEDRLLSNRTGVQVLKSRGGLLPHRFSTISDSVLGVNPNTSTVFLRRKPEKRSPEMRTGILARDQIDNIAVLLLDLQVQQSNQNSPKFVAPEHGYRIFLSTATIEGERIAKVLAVDADNKDTLEYGIKGAEGNSMLEIDPQLGYLRLRKLEDKNTDEVDFAVMVSDQSNPPHRSEVAMKIVVVDGPVPHFSRLHYYFSVSEDAVQGKLVGEVMAGQNLLEKISYNVPPLADGLEVPFTVEEESGKVVLTKRVDREVQDKYNFVVRVHDDNNRESYAFVTVNVMDVNDNEPRFLASRKEVEVREDVPVGQSIFLFDVLDADVGENARVQFEVSSEPNLFSIDPELGILRVQSPGLDWENASEHDLVITARNEGGNGTKLDFRVKVLDVNDNRPKLSKELYNVTMKRSEMRPEKNLIMFNVSDADSKAVQNLTVSVSNNLLVVSGNWIQLIRQPPPQLKSIQAKLVAFDGMHSSEARIQITIVGPSSPPCSDSHENITTSASKAGFVLKELEKDTPELVFSHHLQDGQSLPFQILNNSRLAAKGQPQSGIYKMRIVSKVKKNKVHLRTCVTELRVQIEPTNRSPPQFLLRNFTVEVAENQSASGDKMSFVSRVEAVDPDDGLFGTVSYSIEAAGSSTDTMSFFYMEPKTGSLLTLKPIDRETHSEFVIKVVAQDGGGLQDYSVVKVKVMDVNDNAPQFDQAVYHLKVLENEAVGYKLLQVSARDVDHNSTLAFQLKDPMFMKYVAIDSVSGFVSLTSSLDYEEIQELEFALVVSDGLLNSTALVKLEVLDVNDNSPQFERGMYDVQVKEGVPIGTEVAHVRATDRDSQHFGKVSYTMSGDDAASFLITDEGRIKTAAQLDFEGKKMYRLNVKATDGGTPSLSDDCLVNVVVLDENDNAPKFAVCNMTAVIQEGVEAGQALLRLDLSDADSAPNAEPFRLQVNGSGASAFTVDSMLNLITTRQLSYSEQRQFDLTVTAFDAGGLSSSCPMKVFVKQQSRHQPVVQPLTVSVHILNGEFASGVLGKVNASDKDADDMLRFSLVEPQQNIFRLSHISVDSSDGTVSALSSLLPGLHRYNVSVTDGKYIVYAPVTVDVTDIDQEALDNSVSLTLAPTSADGFVQSHMSRVHAALAKVLSVPITYVRLLAIQDATGENRPKRQTPIVLATPSSLKEVELLLTVSRGESRGYHRPSFVKQKLNEGIARLTAESGLEITSLTSEICRRDTCAKGECRDRLWLDSADHAVYKSTAKGQVYKFPRFQRTFECICRQGFGGRHCDVALNQCSRPDVCNKFEVCIPMDDQPTGLECVCPPGTKGAQCAEPTCKSGSDCSQKEPIGLLGNGFFQLFLSQSVEQRMDLAVEFKLSSRSAVLMHGAGKTDYHTLYVEDGSLVYQWDCGSGEGRIKISQIRVNDGHWHTAKVARRRRQVQVMVDNKSQATATSSGSNDVLNLFSDAMVLTFGAKVVYDIQWTNDSKEKTRSAAELSPRVLNGTVGCIGRIGLDGYDLPKSQQGLRMYNARIGCDTESMGPCLAAPCLNSGQCVPNAEKKTYSCICSQRFTGANCEIDLDACSGQPCPKGIPCHNLYNDFHCSCPSGFTGKTCQMHGDWDPCVTKPCGPFGQCRKRNATFVCACADGFHGSFCSERAPRLLPDGLWPGGLHLYILLGMVVTAVVLALAIGLVCRRQGKEVAKDRSLLEADNAADPLIQATPGSAPSVYRNPTAERPPPRPPRQKSHNAHLPTVEVRPMQSILRHNANDSPPPLPKHRNLYDTAADVECKPQPPPHRSLPKSGKPALPQQRDDHSDYLTMKPVKRSPPLVPAHSTGPSSAQQSAVQLYDSPVEEAGK